MSDPKYNKYAGTVRFDDDNIVDIDLQPDTENIRVLLNGSEVTGGAELPEVDSGDNGKVLTVVSGEWAAATPATPPAELPAVTSDDNGDVLTVVAGEWAKAAPAGRKLYGCAIVSTDPTVDLPSDVPAAPAGFYWYPQNEYTFVNLQTQQQLTLQELSTLNFDNMELRDDIHGDESPVYIPIGITTINTYDPANPADGQMLLKMINFMTYESTMSVGWNVMLTEEI